MKYLIYKIINLKNNKELIGRYIGIKSSIKLNYSSNKYLIKDIKEYGSKNFKKQIIKEFNDETSLNAYYHDLLPKYRNKENSYNKSYILSDKTLKNIKIGVIKAAIYKLNKKYHNFKGTLIPHNNHKYILRNMCKHNDDIIMSIEKFIKKYNLSNDLYCQKCRDEFINLEQTFDEIIENQKRIQNILKYATQYEKSFIEFYYPEIYKSILLWTQKYENINFKERIYLFKNNLKNKPKCLCCDSEVEFSSSKKVYKLYCKEHFIHNISNKEIDVLNFIKNYESNIKTNFIFNKKELDIYIPDKKLAIEFNGIYWHSDLFKEKNYHYNKWKECRDNGINLITIWEDEWDNKQEIVKSILKNNLNETIVKINAINCSIKEIKFKESNEFLNNNHLQGSCHSSINLGLYYKDELVSLMTFSRRKKILGQNLVKNEYELLRFCSKLNTNVIGDASKLFKYFIDNFKPNKIISYVNCDISDGYLNKILGFKEIGHTKINYWWVNGSTKYHKTNFIKRKLVKEGYDLYKTENEIMRERGYYKIYGTGNLKYEYNPS